MEIGLISTLGFVFANLVVSIWGINKESYNKAVTESRLRWLRENKDILVSYEDKVSDIQLVDTVESFREKVYELRKLQSEIIVNYKPYKIVDLSKYKQEGDNNFKVINKYLDEEKKRTKINSDELEQLMLNTLEFILDILEKVNLKARVQMVIPDAELRYINEVLPIYQTGISKHEWSKISKKFFEKRDNKEYSTIVFENVKRITDQFEKKYDQLKDLKEDSSISTIEVDPDVSKYYLEKRADETIIDYLAQTLKRLEKDGKTIKEVISPTGDYYLTNDKYAPLIKPAIYKGALDRFRYETDFDEMYAPVIAREIIRGILRQNKDIIKEEEEEKEKK
ncbi:hypothetical protein BG262_00590 [Floricoccus penangensis]|uniref:Uncharacterized protein n=1 Tax=Floricoccus penangensis TaxID=1859475 RepID=A0A9Q5P0W0_9LACT|nr:hypothetical protein [Floricoccus penangensis]OFI48032.1 hypothetical protein BG262_00590 [Floricoccus penangensis]